HQRLGAADRLYPLIEKLFADRTGEALVEEGQHRGIPIAPVLEPAGVLKTAHYRDRGALADVDLFPGVRATIPTGCLEVNGERAGFRATAPTLGQHNEILDSAALRRAAPATPPAQTETRRLPPFAGLRVLDLGVIVLGAEVGRLFADL